jgi:hypothetical protein
MNTRETGPLPMAPLRIARHANRSLHRHHDPTAVAVDSALTAIGFAIDIREVARRLDALCEVSGS